MDTTQRFKDLVTFLTSLRGDLINVTAPPSFQAPTSAIELPICWAQRPCLFIAPALETDPLKRALRVLEYFLYALEAQYYLGLDENGSVRKPLNSFLGELFFGKWTDETGTVELVGEQVSHHPPITAARLKCEEHGVTTVGFVKTGMTFTGSLHVEFTGHIVMHLDKYDEDYLIPFPSCKMKGILSRKLYPELDGTYYIVSSSGFTSEISFSGEGLLANPQKRNRFAAKLYRTEDESKESLYTVSGQWNKQFTVRSATDGNACATHLVNSPEAIPIQTPDLVQQDSWESRRAWSRVIDAIRKEDMWTLLREKTKLEEAQRAMRRREATKKHTWEPLFFTSEQHDNVSRALAAKVGVKLYTDKTKGFWRFDAEKARRAARPYHGQNTPYGILQSASAGELSLNSHK